MLDQGSGSSSAWESPAGASTAALSDSLSSGLNYRPLLALAPLVPRALAFPRRSIAPLLYLFYSEEILMISCRA